MTQKHYFKTINQSMNISMKNNDTHNKKYIFSNTDSSVYNNKFEK